MEGYVVQLSNQNQSLTDHNFIEQLRQATDIVEVIGEVLTLRRQGRNYIGLCPFHTEKTPSFSVSPEKQIFYCFGCGTGGDVFSFVQKRDGLSFPEAIRQLADRAGLKVPEPELAPDEARRRTERERLQQVVEQASAQFQRWFWADAGRAARAYMEQRGFDEATLRTFGVGWAPPGWDGVIKALGARGVGQPWLIRAGLAIKAEGQDRVYDRFRGRVMFPIWDQRGRAVAFGGRLLPGSPDEDRSPKYLNSPETEIFSKGRGLYGWHLAKGAIREQGFAVVVEGYIDAISCHRAGFANTVASLGTAFTVQQARLLLSQAEQVRVAYDADAAGQGATQRGVDILAGLGADVRIVLLPEGKDPDECISKGGRGAFAAALEGAVDYVEYRFRLAQAEAERRWGAGSAGAAAAAAEAIAPTLVALTSPVARDAYVQRFARLLDVSEASMWRELQRVARAASGQGARQGPGATGATGGARNTAGLAAGTDGPGRHIPSSSRDNIGSSGSGLLSTPALRQAQERLVALMLLEPERIAGIRQQVRAEDFVDESSRGIVRALYEVAAAASGQGGTRGATGGGAMAPPDQSHELMRLLESTGQHDAAALLSRLLVEAGGPPGEGTDRICRDCIRVLQEHSLSNRITEVRQEVQRLEREGHPVPSRLLEEYTRLVRAAKGNLPPAQ